MNTQRINRALAIIWILTAFATVAMAAGQQKIPLTADKGGRGARGDIVLADANAGQKQITIDITGLKPNSVYTVWLVNMKPKMDMLGLGAGDYSFKSDAKGNGHYTAMVSNTELDKWQMVEIAYHPDGNAKEMKKMEIALSGPVKRAK